VGIDKKSETIISEFRFIGMFFKKKKAILKIAFFLFRTISFRLAHLAI